MTEGGNGMTNEYILNTALCQSAVDLGCAPGDLLADENKIVISRTDKRARKYLELPFVCNLVSYGNNIVASVSPEAACAAESYISKYGGFRCFETPAVYELNDKLAAYGAKVCFMAEYFLPDVTRIGRLECAYEMRLLEHDELSELYRPEWSNALCEKRAELDILGVGAYDGEKLIGLAGCSADCERMWQIGIDVLPEYRRRGIASALISAIAAETMERGIVPFYCAAWSNIRSVRSALKSGFRPAWTELTAKSFEFVDSMNNE